MAHVKNNSRRKRKYTEARNAITDKHRTAKKSRADLRNSRAIERTLSLIGKPVYFRTPGNIKPRVGTVLDVISKLDEAYPSDAKRNVGSYLKIRDSAGLEHIKSRSRVKPVKETHAV